MHKTQCHSVRHAVYLHNHPCLFSFLVFFYISYTRVFDTTTDIGKKDSWNPYKIINMYRS
uniref:Uncharacterized protein n=1 Tax=Anguilla anguilla TaxID=7936 RepID=A0A0E9WJN6_ANGAN